MVHQINSQSLTLLSQTIDGKFQIPIKKSNNSLSLKNISLNKLLRDLDKNKANISKKPKEIKISQKKTVNLETGNTGNKNKEFGKKGTSIFKKMIRNFRRHVKEQEKKEYSAFKQHPERQSNSLQKKMEMIFQENSPEFTSTQTKTYKNFYKELIPVLRLFYFLKSSQQLASEVVLEQFKQILLYYKDQDQKFQEKFDNPEEFESKDGNRVRNLTFRLKK